MDVKEEKLAEKIRDKLGVTTVNACTVRERVDEIENKLLGDHLRDEDETDNQTPEGLLHEIYEQVAIIDNTVCDTINTTNKILKEI